MCVRESVCVCVREKECVCEREKECVRERKSVWCERERVCGVREKECEREREREKKRVSGCVKSHCICQLSHVCSYKYVFAAANIHCRFNSSMSNFAGLSIALPK